MAGSPYPNAEIRIGRPIILEARAGERSMPKVRGHAAVFNSLSESLGSFREIIKPGAFADVVTGDVRALFNHNPSVVLARSGEGGTLQLREDETGLYYEFVPVDTTAARDVVRMLEERLITQSSFGFRVNRDGQSWQQTETGAVRTVHRIAELFDVSVVTYPAYPTADAAVRELRAIEQARDVEAIRLVSTRALNERQLRLRGINL